MGLFSNLKSLFDETYKQNKGLAKKYPDAPVFQPKPELLTEPVFDVPNTSEPFPLNLLVRSLPSNVLGRTEAIGGVLTLSISPDMNAPRDPTNSNKHWLQLVRCIQHELGHVLLFRTDYTHSKNEDSLLYYKITGLKPIDLLTEFDRQILKEAGRSINQIVCHVNYDVKSYSVIYKALFVAIKNMNLWCGREVFVIAV